VAHAIDRADDARDRDRLDAEVPLPTDLQAPGDLVEGKQGVSDCHPLSAAGTMRCVLTIEGLESAWHAAAPAPRDDGTLRLICIRKAGGYHETPHEAEIAPGLGLVGDRWSERTAGRDPNGYSAVTLINATVAELIASGRQPLDAAGDNLHVDLDIGVEALPAGTRLRIGTAVLRVSEEPHTGCSTFSGKFGLDALKWVSTPEGRRRRLRGVNCSVVEGGTVRIGDPIVVVERPAQTEPDEMTAAV
jgi:MOSC domain-containing protein YiiM